jgi:hypothetical protein
MGTAALPTTCRVQFECKLEWQLLQANTCNGAEIIRKDAVVVPPKEMKEQTARTY